MSANGASLVRPHSTLSIRQSEAHSFETVDPPNVVNVVDLAAQVLDYWAGEVAGKKNAGPIDVAACGPRSSGSGGSGRSHCHPNQDSCEDHQYGGEGDKPPSQDG
jgi:hypothetical protein